MKAPSIVLIVEDEASLRRALCDKFAREGFTVFEAKDGEVGLTLALKEEPNVILLDMIIQITHAAKIRAFLNHIRQVSCNHVVGHAGQCGEAQSS